MNIVELASSLPCPYPVLLPRVSPTLPPHPIPQNQRNSSYRIRIKLKFKTCGNFRGVACSLSRAREAWSTHPGLTGPQEMPDRWADHNPAWLTTTLRGWPQPCVAGHLGLMSLVSRSQCGGQEHRGPESNSGRQTPHWTLRLISLGLGAVTSVPATVCPP